MPIFLPLRTATIEIPTPPHDQHLFILLTDPVGPAKEVLGVSVCSYESDGYDDESCVLFPGDHDYIKHKSFVAYEYAEILKAQALINGAKDGPFRPFAPIKTDIFARVCHGLTLSRLVPPVAKQFYESFEKLRLGKRD